MVAALSLGALPVVAQVPEAGEVRQLVTFSFLPGRSAEALGLYRDLALPLYEADEAMLSFRVFREVESPIPLDLVVVRGFRGMAGMDQSSAALRDLAARAGTSMGDLYGRIGALTSAHTDELVEMLPTLGSGDPSARRLTVWIRYRIRPGYGEAFERAVDDAVAPLEAELGVPSATGRFLVSDGWDYLRVVGFDSLGAFQAYRARLASHRIHRVLDAVVEVRRETILSNVPDLAVR
jgi:hypothetical protein